MTKISVDLVKNDVPATGQLKDDDNVSFVFADNADLKLLFLGNSITRHGRAENIGWYGDWGMAASSAENDYVHKLVGRLQCDGRKVSFCVTNLSEWEQSWNDALFEQKFLQAKLFNADIVIIRLGENAGLLNRVDEFAPHYENLIDFFAAENAQVVLTDLFWGYEPFDNYVKSLAQKRGFAFAQIHDLGRDAQMKATGQFTHEGVSLHPSDNGMREIADRIYRALTDKRLDEELL